MSILDEDSPPPPLLCCSSQLSSAPLLRCLVNRAGKSKQMKQEKLSAVVSGWIPGVQERLYWLIVT